VPPSRSPARAHGRRNCAPAGDGIGPRNSQALAWEISDREPTIIEKYGGLNNASAYIGMMPSRKLGIVILGNRGNQYPNEVGRRMLLELAGP